MLFQLRPDVLDYALPAALIGGPGESLGTVELPLRLSGYSGTVQMTVLNICKMPPLTLVGLVTKLETGIAHSRC